MVKCHSLDQRAGRCFEKLGGIAEAMMALKVAASIRCRLMLLEVITLSTDTALHPNIG